MDVKLRLAAIKSLSKKIYIAADEDRFSHYAAIRIFTDELRARAEEEFSAGSQDAIRNNIGQILNSCGILAGLEPPNDVPDEEHISKIYKAIKHLASEDCFNLVARKSSEV